MARFTSARRIASWFLVCCREHGRARICRARGNEKKRVTRHSCRSPSKRRKPTKSALFLAGLQIFEQMMNEVVDIALREREGIAAHRFFSNGAISQVLG